MPRIAKFFLALVFILGFSRAAGATTYYISYATGSNSNNGTSKSTPWKTHPYMQSRSSCTTSGSAPSYSHSVGDIFIFKMGDSWPNACFDMVIQAGGTTGNSDQYTYDPTWGTATGTTGNTGQAVGVYEWAAGTNAISGTDGFNRFVENNGNNWITFNGVALNGFKETGTGSFGNDQGIDIQSSTNVILSNCWIHGWNHTGNTTNDDLLWFVGHDGGSSPNNVGSRLTGCVIDGSGASDSGSATWKIPLIDNNIITNMSNAVLSGADASIHDNKIGPINVSFDSGNHANCIEPITFISGGTSTNYIYNNVFFSCNQAALLAQGVGGAGVEIDYVWNNVAYLGTVSQPPASIIQFSSEQSNAGSQAIAWNNTVYAGSTNCFRTLNQGGHQFAIVTIQNNHCITDNTFFDNSYPAAGGTVGNNVTQTTSQATAQGYTASETFAYSPTGATNATVAAGTNLSSSATGALISLQQDTTYAQQRVPQQTRPSSGSWDAGAYMVPITLQVGPGKTFSTIQGCLNVAATGNTCVVFAGTYTENPSFVNSGVSLVTNPGDTVNVSGHISASGKNNCVINGFNVAGFTLTFNGSQTGGIDVRSSTGCSVLNNTVHNGQGAGIYSRLNTNTLIQGNKTFGMTMSQCCFAEGDGIVSYSASSTDNTYAHGVRITGNEVYQNAQDGIEINGSYESIYGNYVHDNITSSFSATHPDGIECNNNVDGITECPHTLIYSNKVKNQNQNIYIDGLGSAAADTDIWIFNNVVWNDTTSSTGVAMATGSSSEVILNVGQNGHIYNNTIGGVSQYFGICLGDCTGGNNTSWQFTNVDIKNNIIENANFFAFWAYPSTSVSAIDYDDYFGNASLINWGTTGYSSLPAFTTATGQESHGKTNNPNIGAFPTPSITAASPAAGAGFNLTTLANANGIPQLLSDFNGATRPTSAPWDIGALNSGISPPPQVNPPLHLVIIAQ